MNKEEAMAVLRAAYDGENLTEAQLQQLLMNSMAQDDEACGFAVEPRSDCPHVPQLPCTARKQVMQDCGKSLSAGCEVCGDTGENWVCLKTGKVLCSRYVAGHMLQHAQAQAPSSAGASSSDAAAGSSSAGISTGSADGASVAISMADFSAWCFACDSYVTDPAVEEVLGAFRAAKFGGGSGSSAAAGSS